MLIEVCGVDGSGKSRLIDALRGQLRTDPGVTAYERVLRSEGRNILEWAATSTRSTFSTRETEIVVMLDVVRQAHTDLHLYRGNSHSHAFVTFHYCALLTRLYRHGLHADASLRQLLTLLPVPDLSLRIDVAPELAMARVRQRPKGDDVLRRVDPEAAMTAAVEAWREAARLLPYPQTTLDGALPAVDVLGLAVRHMRERSAPQRR